MKKYIFIAVCAMFAVAGLQSCMDFDQPGDELTGNDKPGEDVIYHGQADIINYKKEISESGFEEAEQALGDYFGQMLTAEYALRGGKEGKKPVSHQYQYQYNITVDNYAGYFCIPHNFSHGADGVINSTYYFNQKYNDGVNGGFLNVKSGVVPMLNHPKIDSIPELKAIGLLLYDYASQEMADIYGPFPYINYKENKATHPYTYEDMRKIYVTIVDNIDTISACFKHYDLRPDWYKKKVQKILKRYDYFTDDFSIDTWDRFANSLKLRVAMHVVKILPEKAKLWAEEAVKAGVIETTAQEVALKPTVAGFTHPLVEISTTWGDTRLNASFESLLASLKHPYMDYLYLKNSCSLINGNDPAKILKPNSRVVGLRAGSYMIAGQDEKNNPHVGYSKLTSGVELAMAPMYVMKLSEVDFLRAEGALRGWEMKGSAREFYERGIRNAYLEDRGLGSPYLERVNEYMSLEQPVDYTYIDPIDDSNNIKSVTKIGVKWNEGDDNETKLEKIITQKYIAGFPYSYEAWTDLRRTGYPKIFPVLHPDDGDGSLDDGDLIRRMPFPGETSAVAQDIATSGLEALGGADKQGTRLWWDVDAPNF
ncbi:SusD/RagB family nutrient-binding outer membrane lipoprotein [Bacteroides sp.]|uniref:SusD/RagB family nutrient-binding outer membrane lipoprotein n=1 Tax=Bacteroides sp. TaxID=29523 RepID=UPI0025C3BBA3|nr:SusD/RagB family nutrient-binding outer membrane lipoprotein [Bacteroides sp.]